jgi:hypothetical protein
MNMIKSEQSISSNLKAGYFAGVELFKCMECVS